MLTQAYKLEKSNVKIPYFFTTCMLDCTWLLAVAVHIFINQSDLCRTQEGPAFMRLSDSCPGYNRLSHFKSHYKFCPGYNRFILSPFGLVLSFTANLPRTPNIFTDSGPPIKLQVGG